MDFELSDEQRDIQRAAREFAEGEFDPDLAIELDQTGQFPESIWKKASQLGFIGVNYPEEFGGQGLGLFEGVLVIEAFCRVDSGIGSALSTVDYGSEVIIKFGSLEQKKNFLPPLAKGEKRVGIALGDTEDEKDSLPVTAERRQEEYFISGERRLVINASSANLFIVLCREPKEGWITLIAEREKGDIEVRPIERLGLRMISLGDLQFKEVRIPIKYRIGSEDEGIAQVEHFKQVIGLKNAAQALGMAQGAFDRALQYAKQREQFGRKLSQFQVIRHKLADMVVGIEVIRWLTYKSAIEFDQGRIEPETLSITKVEAGRRLVNIVDEALQIFGGYGYIVDQAIEHYYRDARAIAVELGIEEEQKDLIAEKLLGAIQ